MSTCPCCLEALKPAFLGLGGRRLVGACELCGDRVCEGCLRRHSLSPVQLRRHGGEHPDLRRPREGWVCLGCLWELVSEEGETPDFAEPAGHRQRTEQQGCEHEGLVRWMRCCPDCGAEVGWQTEVDAPRCDACGAPSHDLFNACWHCGESFEEDHDPLLSRTVAGLDRACSEPSCEGRVGWPMPFCPWCAAAQRWPHLIAAKPLSCLGCDAKLDPTWAHCPECGEEAPPPERCVECGERMEHASCAARCEECHHLVCGECFADYSVPGEGEEEAEERRLCATCAEELGAERLEAEEDGELEPEEEDEAEAGDDVDEDDRGEDDEDEPPDEEDSDETQADDAGEEPAAEDDSADARQRTGDAGAGGHRSAASGPEPSAWEILGVAPGAPLAEVRKAYLTLIAQYHPDKVAQLGPKLQALALEETRRLNQAFDALRGRGGRA